MSNEVRWVDLNRKTVIMIILAAAIMVSVFYAWYFRLYGATETLKEDFENGFDEWVANADVSLDPNNPGHLIEWSITHSNDVASSGRYSLKFFIDGRQDDGTIWIEKNSCTKRHSNTS